MTPIDHLPRIGSIVTMPSRLASFEVMLPTIFPQLDLLHVYLDGHDKVPPFLDGRNKVAIHSGDDLRGLKADSRMLFLSQLASPAIVFLIDDDIFYPPDYVATLSRYLAVLDGKAIVGVHGRIFLPPHKCYLRDAYFFHFKHGLERSMHVHELGTGTIAFLSDRFSPDPSCWKRSGMTDINIAIDAEARKLSRVVIERKAGWLQPIAEGQPDSLWTRTKTDHCLQDELMRELLTLYR